MKTICIVILLLAGNIALFTQDNLEVVIIEQPKDVIECEGGVDNYFFVVAASSDKQYKIAYRWLKDGRPYSQWVEDSGQIIFDTLDYSMSGVYNAELFAFDPNWESEYGNQFSFDSARVSPIISSEEANLYVLQSPSFIKEIQSQIVELGETAVYTFDANIYGEHNMENPSYWTDIRWFRDSVELENGGRVAGANSSVMSISNIIQDDYSAKYRVRLASDCDTIWSNEFVIYGTPRVFTTYASTNMVTGICIIDDAELRFGVGTIPPFFPVEYQWYMNGKPIDPEEGKFEMKTQLSNVKSLSEVEIKAIWNPDFEDETVQEYYCELWPKGYYGEKITSWKRDFRWHTPIQLFDDLDTIYEVQAGDDVTMGVNTKSSYIIFEWYKDGNILGINSDTLVIVRTILEESGVYQVKMSNACGTVWSKKAKLTVTKKPIISDVEQEFADGVINIYPNPLTSSSILNIRPEKTGDVSVILSDLLGNRLADLYNGKVLQDENRAINLNIDKLGLNSGTYYLNIRIGDDIETRQISIVK